MRRLNYWQDCVRFSDPKSVCPFYFLRKFGHENKIPLHFILLASNNFARLGNFHSTIAEQVGDAGSFLTLVCVDQKIHIEIIFPGAIDLDDDSVVLLQIDNQPEWLVAGFFDKIDATTSVFVGLDRRDEPSAATSDLLKQMAAGNSLYLGDPDPIEAI